MTRVVVSSSNAVSFPLGGGHWWVFAQWILGLRKCGCDVWWLEEIPNLSEETPGNVALFQDRLSLISMEEKALALVRNNASDCQLQCLTQSDHKVEQIITSADLLLNFNYHLSTSTLDRFRRTALIDIDPGLLQFWVSTGQILLPAHDRYFTTGETVGTDRARFSDCGLQWSRIRPVVDTETWPVHYDESCRDFTTVSGWWGGGGEGEWITNGDDTFFENNKRVTFLQFADLPRHISQSFELALAMGTGDREGAAEKVLDRWQSNTPENATEYVDDATDARLLRGRGWSIRLASEVSRSPEDYRRYICKSRGEFSCAKPSCMYFENAWVSDRTLCYLSSGKPVVLQNTGASDFLPRDRGMFRFTTMDDAVAAIDAINTNYRAHSIAARELAEEYFEASRICGTVLARAFG